MQQDSIVSDASISLPETVQADTIKTKSPTGIFSAVLPCNDCKGIEHIVAFYPDGSFKMEEARIEDNEIITKAKGRFKAVNNNILLYKNEALVQQYGWAGDTLILVGAAGKKIGLGKRQSAYENKVWQKRGEEGIEFFGVGNEPFWSIEIDAQKNIVFQLADWKEPMRLQPVAPVVSSDSMVYHLSAGSASMVVTIYDRFCSDGMSDFVYDREVKVVHQDTVYRGCGILYQ